MNKNIVAKFRDGNGVEKHVTYAGIVLTGKPGGKWERSQIVARPFRYIEYLLHTDDWDIYEFGGMECEALRPLEVRELFKIVGRII